MHVVVDLDRKRHGLLRTVLSSHPLALLVGSGHPAAYRNQISIPELEGNRIYLPGIGEEFSPLFEAAKQSGTRIEFVKMPSYYQVLFHVLENGGGALNRFVPDEIPEETRARNIRLTGMPPLCSSFLIREGESASPIGLLRDWLARKIRTDFEASSRQSGFQE